MSKAAITNKNLHQIKNKKGYLDERRKGENNLRVLREVENLFLNKGKVVAVRKKKRDPKEFQS